MSMLDSFFKQRFNAAKCKTLLKLTIPRIKLLRNRREIQVKQMRKDIAKLLETGQEATARIRVEHIIREEKMMAAQEIVELFCELIAVRLPIIDAQRECPLDLKEAISSVCFAAPRCADLPELLQVQMLFAGKYGKEFVSAATELMPECGVNRQLVELLSVRSPAPDVKLKLLKEIAEEHELDWDPAATESELLKPHEDLLNGSTLFVTGSKVPLPEEKHQETTHTTLAEENTGSSEVDPDLLDFPEVPKQPLIVQHNKGAASAPEMLHFPPSALSDPDDEDEPSPVGPPYNGMPSNSSSKAEDEQFVPFISPPPQSLPGNSPVPKTENNEKKVDLGDVIAAAQAAAETAERAAAAARSAASLAQLRISELVKKKDDGTPDPNEAENQSHHPHEPVSDDSDKLHSIDPSSPPGVDVVDSGVVPHQPQRLPSMDDETYFSYPNLFSSQGSNLSTHQHSFTDAK
ncbi:Regulator of Vps4 activity in the MVB pathway protein [Striga hermonthica]|uniref:Regulator of Vps4 activity in the MVB pathway protein n=1 Tax=Striga hermonthica TaxID=68872 RepID=A0A9N7NVB4_STRHE|nr:Regulator of Vps4 activity in the MVB pathway protein [Striga hermonthica]